MTELAANTPSERVTELIRLTRRLTALLDQETALFNARKPREAIGLQDEKQRLTLIYRRESQLAAKDPSRLDGAPDVDRQTLREATKTFEQALERNGVAVDSMQRLSEGLVKAIVEEARRQRKADAGYGPGAEQAASIGALALDSRA